MNTLDAIVIGGGFYGCSLAVFLARHHRQVVLIEGSDELMTRASYINQARVHNGYHYPRSFMTALRSAANFPRFAVDFLDCVAAGFEKVYAIARTQSKVSAYQFQRFCQNIKVPARTAPKAIRDIFNPELIEDVFCVREFAFDAARLREKMRHELATAKVDVRFRTEAVRIGRRPDGLLDVVCAHGDTLRTKCAFNCTYSQINELLAASGLDALPLKHELTELALMQPPPQLRELGVTVMDGPFFSAMPFPALGLHSLSHVRYTPHESWSDGTLRRNPHHLLTKQPRESNWCYMQRDSQRYLPAMTGARHVRSLFTIKTVLLQNEVDDGRPILMRWHPELGAMATILGGKIDNIYDVLDALTDLKALSARPASH